MKSKPRTASLPIKISGQPSWRLKSDKVEAFLTVLGGQLGPVTFRLEGRKVQPYSVAPWAEEKEAAGLIPILRVLRGDFFCMPFGGNATPWRGEQHPVHGETANGRWRLESLVREPGRVSLHASLRTKVRPGRVDKHIHLLSGHAAVYCQHVISGMSGPMNLGHHAMLRFPDEPESGVISTSAFRFGQVSPTAFEKPAEGGYSALKIGAEFRSLASVPLAGGGVTDVSRYPARRGFEDLLLLANDPKLPFAWMAVVFPKQRYVWFALKDPRVLRQTIFWISNGGRHYSPWNGRHVGVLGLEEVTSLFAYGLAESVQPNALAKRGIPTALKLNARKPLVVPYIMAMATVPAGFDGVRDIVPSHDGQGVNLLAESGRKATASLCLEFLKAPAGW